MQRCVRKDSCLLNSDNVSRMGHLYIRYHVIIKGRNKCLTPLDQGNDKSVREGFMVDAVICYIC